jgi:hypothetical protein
MSRADDVAHQIQYQEAGTLNQIGRQAVQADVGGEPREFGGDAHGIGSSSVAVTVAQRTAGGQGCEAIAPYGFRPGDTGATIDARLERPG